MLSLSLDSPLYSISNVHIRRNILAIFVFGFVLGHVSFVIGAIIALEATRALIQVALYRSAWIRFLRDDVPKLFRKTQQGRITASKIEYNELTGEPERCWVSFEYHTAIRNDPKKLQQRLIERTIDSQDGNYSLEKVLYFLQQIQADEERTKSKRKISYVYMAQDVEIGFPFQYIEIKRQEQLFWARYVDICIVFFGFQLYFMAAFIHAKLSTEDVRDVMVRAALSPILMTPYLVVQSSFQHKQRIQAWKNDPLRVSSELESMQKYWQWMGPTWLRKFYGALFLLGVTGLFLCCGWMVLFLGLAMIYAIVEWIDVEAPIKRETLKEFQSQTKTVAATVDECWLEFSNSFLFGSTGYWVRISYITPSGDAVTKDVQSKMLYDLFAKQNRGNRSIEVLVHPDFPRSGYPSLQFFGICVAVGRCVLGMFSPSS
ncbi:hypothetical protein IV203_020775 [Nitzschia inconspicua]|uniref:Uncharacterized protein n=1 Tax=Nitzschia inconspicua TaxID=303405 RepID=A0A9K3KGB3_9STRA|nr:hypothetical protein IV203_020775 [Nitzschia inconspicua]